MSTLMQRFILVSDMHYTTDKSAKEFKAEYPEANVSAASGTAFGKTQAEKIRKIYTDILEENKNSALDGVLVLGDLSIDDWDFRKLPFNYCQRFKEECMDTLPCPAYAIPGNHDSYTNDTWKRIFGYDRQFAVAFGDTVFIMADTFASVPANGASGSAHTRLDGEFLLDCLKKYKGKRIFLCAHYFDADESFDEKTKQIIKDSPEIVCLFRGHVHVSSVIELGREMGDKTLIDIGGYGYCGRNVGGRWDFNTFDQSWAWGYQVLEIYDDTVRTYHVKTANRYIATNGCFDTVKTVEDEKKFTFIK